MDSAVSKEIHHISEEAQEAYDKQFGIVPYTFGNSTAVAV